MEERYIASVDLGSSKIGISVALIAGNNIQILYYKERPSAGIRNGSVYNPKQASGPIGQAIAEAEEALNIKINKVVAGFPRCDVRQKIAEAEVERENPDDCISSEEVENLKASTQNECPLKDPSSEQLYVAVAQSFSDEENFQVTENDIIGAISPTLKGNFKLFIGKRRGVSNLEKTFSNLGITVAKEYFAPIAVARAVLTDDEKDNGVALVDFGGGATSVTIYKGRILRYYACIPFGGKNISADIHSVCAISDHLAENIKLAYGACLPDKLQNMEEKIIQINDDEIEDLKQIPVKHLSEIITARENEIIEAILYEIQESGFSRTLRSGMVITGGGAQLTNLSTMLKELSGYNVRVGSPRRRFSASGCPEVYTPSATFAVGMVLLSKEDENINCIDMPVARLGDVFNDGGESPWQNTGTESYQGNLSPDQDNSEESRNTNLFPDEELEEEKQVPAKGGKKGKKEKSVKKKLDRLIWKLYDDSDTNENE